MFFQFRDRFNTFSYLVFTKKLIEISRFYQLHFQFFCLWPHYLSVDFILDYLFETFNIFFLVHEIFESQKYSYTFVGQLRFSFYDSHLLKNFFKEVEIKWFSNEVLGHKYTNGSNLALWQKTLVSCNFWKTSGCHQLKLMSINILIIDKSSK